MVQFVRDRILPHPFIQLFVQTGLRWQRDHCSAMGAALAYYALFSLFPILLVVLSVLGRIVGPDTDLYGQIQVIGQQFLPPAARDVVRGTLLSLNAASTGAGLVGFGILMYSASTVFGMLNESVNIIWRTADPQTSTPLRQTVLAYVINKAIAFALVFSVALLLLASMVSNIFVETTLRLMDTFETQLSWLNVDDIPLADGLQVGSSVAILTVTSLILLKILPSTRVAWRDLWPGALLTAVLLVILQRLVSNSVISIGSRYASYGVVGSVMILLLWIYFTCQVFFIGCEFSYVYAHLFGSCRGRSHL
jgi:membrane protein